MLDRLRRHDNEQNVELQGLNKHADATVNETDRDRLSVESPHGSSNKHRPGRVRQWLFEILSVVGALLLLCAIVGLLVGYHDTKQPVWKYSINLNSLVALLSTLFKALMMVAVAEGMAVPFPLSPSGHVLDLNLECMR
jgi:branched-subunit amino acid transport protein